MVMPRKAFAVDAGTVAGGGAGAGPGGGPHVEVFAGFRLELLMNFFSGDQNDKRGIFVGR